MEERYERKSRDEVAKVYFVFVQIFLISFANEIKPILIRWNMREITFKMITTNSHLSNYSVNTPL